MVVVPGDEVPTRLGVPRVAAVGPRQDGRQRREQIVERPGDDHVVVECHVERDQTLAYADTYIQTDRQTAGSNSYGRLTAGVRLMLPILESVQVVYRNFVFKRELYESNRVRLISSITCQVHFNTC